MRSVETSLSIRAERSRPARCLSSFVAFPFNQALIKRYYDQIITAPQSVASPYQNMTDDSKSKTTEAHGSKRTETGRNGPKRQPRLGTNETFRNGAEMCRDSTVSERFCANIVSARFGTFRFISVTYLVGLRGGERWRGQGKWRHVGGMGTVSVAGSAEACTCE